MIPRLGSKELGRGFLLGSWDCVFLQRFIDINRVMNLKTRKIL